VVEEAGLFEVKGGTLIEIVHFDEMVSPAVTDDLIMGGDERRNKRKNGTCSAFLSGWIDTNAASYRSDLISIYQSVLLM